MNEEFKTNLMEPIKDHIFQQFSLPMVVAYNLTGYQHFSIYIYKLY